MILWIAIALLLSWTTGILLLTARTGWQEYDDADTFTRQALIGAAAAIAAGGLAVLTGTTAIWALWQAYQ